MEIIKNKMKILKLKSRITKMKKKSLDEFTSKFEIAKERTSKFEEMSIKMIESKEQRENNWEEEHQSLRDL